MPIYEYDCNKCLRPFDLLIPASQRDQPATCPECGSTDSRRKVSQFSARSSGSDGSSRSVGGAAGCGSCSATSCGSCHGH